MSLCRFSLTFWLMRYLIYSDGGSTTICRTRRWRWMSSFINWSCRDFVRAWKRRKADHELLDESLFRNGRRRPKPERRLRTQNSRFEFCDQFSKARVFIYARKPGVGFGEIKAVSLDGLSF